MEQVNVAPPVVQPIKKRTRSQKKKPLPDDRRRKVLSVRVLPSTFEYLEGMGYSTSGRALDVLVKAVQHGGIQEMIDKRAEFGIVNLLS